MNIFDIDGVVANIQPWFIFDLCESIGCTHTEIDITSHNIKIPGYNVSDEQIFDIAVHSTVKHVDDILPHKYAFEYIHDYYLRTRDRIHFLTARKGAAVEKATMQWLNKYMRCDFTVHFNENKVQFMKVHPEFDVIFEDRFKTANELDFVRFVYLLSRPWNIGRIAKPHVIRIDSMCIP